MTQREFSSDVAFTPTVKALQTQRGSRAVYSRMERSGAWETRITPMLRDFIALQTSAFLATVNHEGQPYIQHRGGPPGFLHVLDEHTLGFVDYTGNRQYITTGNLHENAKAHLFLIDHARRMRIKIWGEARVSDDADLMLKLMPPAYRARPEQVILFKITAWDANCPQHIPQRIDAEDVARALHEKDVRIATLEDELQRLRKQIGE